MAKTSYNELPKLDKSRAQVLVCRFGIMVSNILSLITTATGLAGFIFSDTPFMAFALSLVIQFTLLVLSMRICYHRNFVIVICYLAALGLSSFFSYVFISNSVYERVWSDISRSVVTEWYRTDLYEAQEYLDNNVKLVSDQISEIASKQAQSLPDKLNSELESSGIGAITAENILSKYSTEEYTADGLWSSASDEHYDNLEYAVNAIEAFQGTNKNPSQQERDELVNKISEAITSIESAMTKNEEEIRGLEYRQDEFEAELRWGNSQFQASWDQIVNSIQKLSHKTYTVYPSIRSDLNKCKGALDKLSSGSAVSISDAILGIQNLLLSEKSDSETTAKMEEYAAILRDSLQDEGTRQSSGMNDADFSSLLKDVKELNDAVQNYANIASTRDFVDNEVIELKNTEANTKEAVDAAVEGLSYGTPEYTNAKWNAEKAYWTGKIAALREHIGSLPLISEDTSKESLKFREDMSKKLDDISLYFLSETDDFVRAINYWRLPLRHWWGFLVSIVLAFVMDLIPLALNGVCKNITEGKKKLAK